MFTGQAFYDDGAGGKQPLNVDASPEPHGLEQKDQIFSDDVSRRSGGIRAAAKPALRSVERFNASFECCHNVGESLSHRVVEVRCTSLVAELVSELRKHALDLRRICIAGGIG